MEGLHAITGMETFLHIWANQFSKQTYDSYILVNKINNISHFMMEG